MTGLTHRTVDHVICTLPSLLATVSVEFFKEAIKRTSGLKGKLLTKPGPAVALLYLRQL